jgi:hypothetical protein
MGQPTQFEFYTPAKRRIATIGFGAAFAIAGLFAELILPDLGNNPMARGNAMFLGTLICAVGLILVYIAYRTRRVRVQLNADAVILLEGEQTQTILLDDVMTVREARRLGAPYEVDNVGLMVAWALGENHMITLEDHFGQCLVLRNVVADFQKLVDMVKKVTLPRLVPPASAAIKNGNALSFGDLIIDRHEVRRGDTSIPWQDVKTFEEHKGVVTIVSKHKWLTWAKCPITQIPNAHVLIALAQEILGEYPSAGERSSL